MTEGQADARTTLCRILVFSGLVRMHPVQPASISPETHYKARVVRKRDALRRALHSGNTTGPAITIVTTLLAFSGGSSVLNVEHEGRGSRCACRARRRPSCPSVPRSSPRSCGIVGYHVIYQVVGGCARRVPGWQILWARRRAEVVIHRYGGGRLGSFRSKLYARERGVFAIES